MLQNLHATQVPHLKFAAMETVRTSLMPLTKNDFPDMLAMLGEPETAFYIKHLQNLSRTEYKSILDNRLAQLDKRAGYHWTARLKSSNTFIGALNLSPIPNTTMMQIGFQFRTKYWNHGFASELAKKVLEFGIHQIGLQTIYGVFETENIASRKVLEKLGFAVDENKIHLEGPIEIYKYNN